MPYDPGYKNGHSSVEPRASGSAPGHLGPVVENGRDQMDTDTESQGDEDAQGEDLEEDYSDVEMLSASSRDELALEQPLVGLSHQPRKALILQSPQPSWTTQPQKKAPSLATAKVAVILQTSPKKEEYAMPEEEEEEDELLFVTSDLTPRRKKKRRLSEDAPRTVSFEPTPVPFPIPNIAAPQKQQEQQQQQQLITPQPKKRGRPPGWRLGSGPYSAMKPGAGGPPLSKLPKPPKEPGGLPRPKLPKPPKEPSGAKRRGRPPKAPPLTAREIYLRSNPKFPVFPCEWGGCPAQLQNFDFLRAHVFIVHGASGTCRWGDCSSKHADEKRVPILDEDAFQKHMEKTHLRVTLWQRGDGPRNTSIPTPWTPPRTDSLRKRIPSYLCNGTGEQVTPLATLEVESVEERKQRRVQLERMLQLRDDNAPPEPVYTQEDLRGIAETMDMKKKRQRMLREYHAKVVGGDGQKPVYGPEWKGLLVGSGSRAE